MNNIDLILLGLFLYLIYKYLYTNTNTNINTREHLDTQEQLFLGINKNGPFTLAMYNATNILENYSIQDGLLMQGINNKTCLYDIPSENDKYRTLGTILSDDKIVFNDVETYGNIILKNYITRVLIDLYNNPETTEKSQLHELFGTSAKSSYNLSIDDVGQLILLKIQIEGNTKCETKINIHDENKITFNNIVDFIHSTIVVSNMIALKELEESNNKPDIYNIFDCTIIKDIMLIIHNADKFTSIETTKNIIINKFKTLYKTIYELKQKESELITTCNKLLTPTIDTTITNNNTDTTITNNNIDTTNMDTTSQNILLSDIMSNNVETFMNMKNKSKLLPYINKSYGYDINWN